MWQFFVENVPFAEVWAEEKGLSHEEALAALKRWREKLQGEGYALSPQDDIAWDDGMKVNSFYAVKGESYVAVQAWTAPWLKEGQRKEA